MVKRYECSSSDADTWHTSADEDKNGTLVKYGDYLVLTAKCAMYREALEGVMRDVGKSLTQERYDQVQEALKRGEEGNNGTS